MLYLFMLLAAIMTVITPRILDIAPDSIWIPICVSLTILFWVISAFLIYTEIENAKKQIKDLQKKVEDLENGNNNK